MKFGFVGPSYTLRSPSSADEECINFFVQTVEAEAGVKNLCYTPGLSVFSPDSNGGPLRGQWWTGSQYFAVDGDTLYAVDSTGKRTAIGYVGSDGLPVSIVSNVNQLFVVSNGRAYCYTLAPSLWQANTAFTVGALILDPAGHVQMATAAAWMASTDYALGAEIVDAAGNIQQAQQAKWAPSTSYALNALIVDGAGHIQKATASQWAPSTLYSLGAEIIDSNGNIQKAFAYGWSASTSYAVGFQLVDSNGNVQQVITAGMSASTVPAWSSSSTTADGTVVWTYQSSAGGNAGTSGTSVPVWNTFGATPDATDSTLFWEFQASAKGNAGTSGAAAPSFSDSGGTAKDGATILWQDEGLAPNAGTSGSTIPAFDTGTIADNGTLIWVYQQASGGSAGTSGATQPAFSDTGGTIQDGSGTLIWKDKGLQLLDVTPQMQGSPLRAEYSDGYFLVTLANTNKYQISDPLDGTTWQGLFINEVAVFSDNIVSIVVNHREPWIFGQLRSQPYQDTGSSEIFDVVPGALIEKGAISAFSPCRLDNSIFWVDQDERGGLSGWRSNGYIPQRISTFAVEQDLGTNSRANLQNMVSYAYMDAGHEFWMIYVPNSQWSWCYDVTESMWHKRATWSNGAWGPHQSWNHSYAFGKHLVGDWATGNIYQMSLDNLQDVGLDINRLRRSPTVISEMERLYHAELTLDFDAGVVSALTDGNGKPRAPQVMLRFSDNRGKTWSNQHVQGIGLTGQYQARAVFRRLGQSRYRIYEMRVSDAVPWTLVEAYLKVAR